MKPQERLIAMAKAEVGYVEKASNSQLNDKKANPGVANYNKYAAIMDTTDVFNGRKQGADWCAVFVVCMFYLTFGLETMRKITGIPARSMAAGVRYLRQYFASIGGLVSYPQPGDVIFFKTADGSAWQHTGIVTAVENNLVYTVEGNAGTPQGVNGFAYPLNYTRIGGYGRPKWELVPAGTEPEEDTPENPPKTPVETQDGQDEDLPAETPDGALWSADGREWGISTGLFAGNGQGDYMWPNYVTREQLAVILYKYDRMRGTEQ